MDHRLKSFLVRERKSSHLVVSKNLYLLLILTEETETLGASKNPPTIQILGTIFHEG